MIPLTVPETGRLLAHPPPPGSAGHRLDWRPPPGPLTRAPPAHTPRPRCRNYPGQLANGDCRSRYQKRNNDASISILRLIRPGITYLHIAVVFPVNVVAGE
jgi:hypothetical protein